MAEEERKPVRPRVRIENYRDFPSARSKRAGKLDRVVTYMVDAEGPYSLIMSAENWNIEKFIRRVREEEKERSEIIGRVVELE